MSTVSTAIDEQRLEEFMHRFVGDIGAAMSAALVVIGDRLGLYRAMADCGPITAEKLARRTQTSERYVREWLSNQAAGGYVSYDPRRATSSSSRPSSRSRSPRTAARRSSPARSRRATAMVKARSKVDGRVRSAATASAGASTTSDLFRGTERFFRPGYPAHLVSSWIPALDGVEAKLEAGARVADVGCGHGASTILMAQAFPRSRFVGFDYHAPSIAHAQRAAAEAGVADRVTLRGRLGQGISRAARLRPRDACSTACTTWAIRWGPPRTCSRRWPTTAPGCSSSRTPAIDFEDNLNPVGRVFYAASTLVCTPASRAQEVGLALGAQAGEARLSEVLAAGGFTRVRRATETAFNIVLEARP